MMFDLMNERLKSVQTIWAQFQVPGIMLYLYSAKLCLGGGSGRGYTVFMSSVHLSVRLSIHNIDF